MRELGNKFDIGMKKSKEPWMTLKDHWRAGRDARAPRGLRSMPSSWFHRLENPFSLTAEQMVFPVSSLLALRPCMSE